MSDLYCNELHLSLRNIYNQLNPIYERIYNNVRKFIDYEETIDSLLGKLEEQASCYVCMEPFEFGNVERNPCVIYPCKHVLCYKCNNNHALNCSTMDVSEKCQICNTVISSHGIESNVMNMLKKLDQLVHSVEKRRKIYDAFHRETVTPCCDEVTPHSESPLDNSSENNENVSLEWDPPQKKTCTIPSSQQNDDENSSPKKPNKNPSESHQIQPQSIIPILGNVENVKSEKSEKDLSECCSHRGEVESVKEGIDMEIIESVYECMQQSDDNDKVSEVCPHCNRVYDVTQSDSPPRGQRGKHQNDNWVNHQIAETIGIILKKKWMQQVSRVDMKTKYVYSLEDEGVEKYVAILPMICHTHENASQ